MKGIVTTNGIAGGTPVLEGTRLRVSHIYVENIHIGMSPGEIAAAHPQLTLSDVHNALAYAFQNLELIRKEIKEDRELFEQLKKEGKIKKPILLHAE